MGSIEGCDSDLNLGLKEALTEWDIDGCSDGAIVGSNAGWKALVCKLVGTQDVTMEVCKGLNTENSIEGDEEPVEGIIERSSEGLLEGSFLSIIIDAVMDGSDGLTIDG